MSGNGAALTNINASNVTSGTLVVAQGGTGTGTAFTTGSVVFAGGSGVYTQNNANLFWDNSNIRLGVGTAAPAASIHLVNETNSGWRYDQYNNSDGTNFRNFRARGTIASPTAVQTNDRLGSFLAAGYSTSSFSGINGGISIFASENYSGTSCGTYVTFGTTANGANTGGGGTERARIHASGGVSIGNTTDPGATNLSVTGSVTAASFSGNGVALTAINASNISSGTVATARLGSGTANASTFLRGDQTYAVPASGTTITNDTSTNSSFFPVFTTATSGSISAANVSNTKLFFNPSTGTLTATVHTSNSDERLKENWTDVAPDFISKLAQVKHGVFSRKDSGNREPGIGAQSFMTVLPEAVVEGADGFLSVNYGGAALVAAIELAKVVEELRAEIAELKAK
jgi:hypothetical protein